jgi:uncharacterized protein
MKVPFRRAAQPSVSAKRLRRTYMTRDTLVLEGIVTTVSAAGEVNIAPMGPRVDRQWKNFTLRPFQTAQTFKNLQEHGEGVFHVVDDVLLLAQAAVGSIEPAPLLLMATKVRGHILRDACRFYEFVVDRIDDRAERAEIDVHVVASGKLHDFFGFNRAKHAVVEAAILATRVHLLPRPKLLEELQRLAVPVDKTGGSREREAFAFLREYVEKTAPSVNGATA